MEFPARAFAKADPSPDDTFYTVPRFVAHIDDAAIAAVTGLYREILPPGADVLDLMSSWISHVPEELTLGRVIGHGMNGAELSRNPRLTEHFVQNLNARTALPLEDGCVDAVLCCVSVQYLQHPVEVWREALRVARPGAVAAVTFSNRMFPTKAVALWQALDMEERRALVATYLAEAGWSEGRAEVRSPRRGDPLMAVTVRKA